MTPELTNKVTAELIEVMGSDDSVIDAARVSVGGTADGMDLAAKKGFIEFLMKNRHGSPFEHTTLKYRLDMPLFVARELVRHRIGISWNEVSGRYTQLEPRFYMPPENRPLVQQGKPGDYQFVPGSTGMYEGVEAAIHANSVDAWKRYERMLDDGVAKEVARMVLPVNVMTQVIWTCNLRSLMAVLSLRTAARPGNHFPSHPQWEIAELADQLELEALAPFPLSMIAFNEHGRVSP